MELKNAFHLAVPIERAWEVLTDLELIAPCVPGATVTEVKKTAVHGTIEVKAGPLTLAYAGKARILKRDKAAHTAILRAEGKEADGSGQAQADVKAQLSADPAGTAVALSTYVDATGRLAQLGQGILEDVHAMVLGRFVAALEAGVLADELLEPPGAGESSAPDPARSASEATPATEAAPTVSPAPPVAAVARPAADAGGRGGARRFAPLLGAVALAWLVRTLVRRRRR